MNGPRTASRLIRPAAILLLTLIPVCGQQTGGRAGETQEAVKGGRRTAGRILEAVPAAPDPKARYLFYLHGLIVEEQGTRPTSPKHGVYEYREILEHFRDEGFVVISEARPKGTDAEAYGAKVAGQVRGLLGAGVPPRHVTVVGASRGGVIAMIASTLLRERRVRFVIMASCGDYDIFKRFRVDLAGEILSVYDDKDDVAGTCAGFFERSSGVSKRKEVVLKLGLGHGILYRPLKEWTRPVAAWARRS
jgi:pimeloyl-ACP methyl ester carboxylesterase